MRVVQILRDGVLQFVVIKNFLLAMKCAKFIFLSLDWSSIGYLQLILFNF